LLSIFPTRASQQKKEQETKLSSTGFSCCPMFLCKNAYHEKMIQNSLFKNAYAFSNAKKSEVDLLE